MVRIFAVICLVCIVISSDAQREDAKLKRQLTQLTNSFHGDIGIYVRHLSSGKTVMINADTIFPTASMIKVPITIGMFNKIEKGQLDYDNVVVYKDSLLYAGEDILGSFKSGEKISLGKVLMLMITTSDNTASL